MQTIADRQGHEIETEAENLRSALAELHHDFSLRSAEASPAGRVELKMDYAVSVSMLARLMSGRAIDPTTYWLLPA